MRISQTLADQVAHLMVKPKSHELLKEYQDQKREILTEFLRQRKEFKELQKLSQEDFKRVVPFLFKTSEFELRGEGLTGRVHISLQERVYVTQEELSRGYLTARIQVPSEVAKKIWDRVLKIDKERSRAAQMIGEIKSTLLALKTYKQVQDNFPEAYQFFPKTGNTTLMIPVKDVTNKWKQTYAQS